VARRHALRNEPHQNQKHCCPVVSQQLHDQSLPVLSTGQRPNNGCPEAVSAGSCSRRRARADDPVFAIAPRQGISTYAPLRARIVDCDSPLPGLLTRLAPVTSPSFGGKGHVYP
jgi:hypothetical protein